MKSRVVFAAADRSMLKYLATCALATMRWPFRDQGCRRPACRLTVEALEGRLLLSGDMVLRWNAAMLAAVQTAGIDSRSATRVAAIAQAVVYDAVNSIDQSYTPYLALIPAPAGASQDAAAAQAAHDALVGLFPAQAAVLDLDLKASLQGIADGDAKTGGIVVGQMAAHNILAARANDGSNKTVTYTVTYHPGDWQPTPPAYGLPLTPQWPLVTPFAIQSGSQFRTPPPPALTSPEYTAAFNQIKDLGSFDSTTRSADQTEAALFWQGITTPTRTGIMWNDITEVVAVAKNNTLVQNARLFALLDLTGADDQIACFDSKYTYNFWRPVTGIRAAFTTGNPHTMADPNWTPLFATPSHPSYPAAHATYSTAEATLLGLFFGTDTIPFSLSFEGLPGVTRSFDSFSAAAHEAGQSRIWAGIHWAFDTTAGETQGAAVATYIFQNFLLPHTSPPSGGGAAAILFATGSITAGIAPGDLSLRADAADAGLPAGRLIVYPVPADATSHAVVSDTRAMEATRARSEGAQPQTRSSSVDDVFASADRWEERLTPAP